MDHSLTTVQKNADVFKTMGEHLLKRSSSLVIKKAEDTQVASSILKDCQETEKELEAKRLEITKPLNNFITEVNTLFKETANPILQAKNEVKQKILAYNQEQERIQRAEQEKLFAEERARLQKLEMERLERERIERETREKEERRLAEEREKLRKLEEERIQEELQSKKANEEEQKRVRDEAERQRQEREALENEKLELERRKREVDEEKRRLTEQKVIEEKKRADEAALAKKQEELRVKGIIKRWSYEIVDEAKVPRAFCSSDSKKIGEAIKTGVREIEGIRIYQENNVR